MATVYEQLVALEQMSPADLREQWKKLTGDTVPRISPALLRLLKPGDRTSLIPREEKPPTLLIPPRQRTLFEFGTAPTGAENSPVIQATNRCQRALRATE